MKRSILALALLSVAPVSMANAQQATARQATATDTLPLSLATDARFLSLSETGIARLFPNASTRPAAVFVTQDRGLTVTIEYRRNVTFTPEQLTAMLSSMPAAIAQKDPKAKDVTSDMLAIGGAQWAQFVHHTEKNGTERRVEQLYASVKGRPVVITISGSSAAYEKNKAAARNLINSLRLD